MYSLQLREKQKTRILNICNIEAMRVVIKRREGKSTPSMDIVKKETQNRGTRSLPNHDKKKKKKKGMLYTMNQQQSIHIC